MFLIYKKVVGKGWDKEDESYVNGLGRILWGEVREIRYILIVIR